MHRNPEGGLVLSGEIELFAAHAVVKCVLQLRDTFHPYEAMPTLEEIDERLCFLTSYSWDGPVSLDASRQTAEPAEAPVHEFSADHGKVLVTLMETVCLFHSDPLVANQINVMLAEVKEPPAIAQAS